MIDIDVYDINGEEYILLMKKEIDQNTYLYLANKNKEKDFMLRKIDPTDSDYLIPLDDEDEVRKVALIFLNEQLNQ